MYLCLLYSISQCHTQNMVKALARIKGMVTDLWLAVVQCEHSLHNAPYCWLATSLFSEAFLEIGHPTFNVDNAWPRVFSMVVVSLLPVCLRRLSSPVTHQPLWVYKALLPLLWWLPLLVPEQNPLPPPLSVYVQTLHSYFTSKQTVSS